VALAAGLLLLAAIAAGSGAVAKPTAAAAASPSPPCAVEAPNPIARVGRPGGTDYALTFDEPLGPMTTRILDILDQYGARATFFIVGADARRHPWLVREIASRGHELANHTFSHPYLSTLSPSDRRRELGRTQAVIRRIAGVTPCFMRPPGLDYNPAIVRQAGRLGLRTVLCDVLAGEFERGAAEVTRIVGTETQPGSIVLFHQVPIAVWSLPGVLTELAQRGLTPTTVGDLLRE
jgi:peptidoglycan-N-acetylglucosamine deacetylase